jgi:leucine dehydrogenase
VHSTLRGPALGGCRLASYLDSGAAIRDALRLSRAMTFKAAVADLTLGGGKGVIMAPPDGALGPRRRHAALLDFADSVQSLGGTYVTAEDVGTSSRDMAVIAERTEHVAGLARSRGGSGDPSPLTALGVVAAIEACCERVFGSRSLQGRTVGVVGLGHVGSRIAKRCARAGARLVVADVDERKRGLAEQLGARWSTPEETVEAALDVLAPCALGGVLDDRSVARLHAPIVAGAANNQLADERIADVLADAGVLWAPDFVVNAGGIINIAEELGGYEPSRARRRVRGIGEVVALILEEAARGGTTPLAAAMEIARRRLDPRR